MILSSFQEYIIFLKKKKEEKHNQPMLNTFQENTAL